MAEAGPDALTRNWAAVERFQLACERDERVIAAFLGGSLASGRADEHSDIDLYLIAHESACAELIAEGEKFLASFSEPVFVDVTRDFEGLGCDMLHFVLSDGVKGELVITHPGNFQRSHGGAHKTLVDKRGVLEGAEFPLAVRSAEERRVADERALSWFWLHLIGTTKALGRDRLWVAHHQLDQMRSCLWQLLAAAQLPAAVAQAQERRMAASVVGLDRGELLAAAGRLVETYHVLAPAAAAQHGVDVPNALARIVEAKLKSAE